MQPKFLIRDETQADIGVIHDVTVAAFQTMPYSSHTEQYIIEELRAANALVISLVAEREGQLVGHIAFSPVTVSDGTAGWYGLGPVSVLSRFQRQGIGKALIEEGLARLRALGAQGCCLVGHPEYYVKFGFHNFAGLVYEGVPPEYFFALPFGGHVPHGVVAFHDAFLVEGSQGEQV